MPPTIPLPTDDELAPEHRELLATMPPLNVFRMVAGSPRALRPFLGLGGAVLSSALDAPRRELVVRYGPREAADVILLASYYNMVSRFLESTRVEIEDQPLLNGPTPVG
ncbi:MAG TPA: hypothetical protein VMU32_06010 [Solirubrobacteraceae bacterium]|nr:hypothetical protein [Solirubrobacteraceae bacterium]